MELADGTNKSVKNRDLSIKKDVDVKFVVVDEILQVLETELIQLGPSRISID